MLMDTGAMFQFTVLLYFRGQTLETVDRVRIEHFPAGAKF
jgi:hypothetical protein